MHENDELNNLETEGKIHKKGQYQNVLAILLFLFSLAVLFFTVNYLFGFIKIPLKLPFLNNMISSNEIEGFAVSYLTRDSKMLIQKELVLLMGKNKEELYHGLLA